MIDFFGYTLEENTRIASQEKQKGKIVLYDSTHKIDGNARVEKWSDYSFCSYRKWFYCNFAKAIKYHGDFFESTNKIHKQYLSLRNEAARQKREYLKGEGVDKFEFLRLFKQAEEILKADYEGYSGTPVAYDMDEIIYQRRKNASYLINKLKNISGIKLWRNSINDSDSPMFVPILLEPQLRNEIRAYLISKEIYCPIHWERPSYQTQYNELFEKELSLVCDQRYDEIDMERIADAIQTFMLDRR